MEGLIVRLFLFATALAVTGVSGYLAVVGFTSNYGKGLDTFALAASVEIGKIALVSFLSRYPVLRLKRLFLFVVLLFLSLGSSVGIYGFLSARNDDAVLAHAKNTAQIAELKSKERDLVSRLDALDAQVEQLPTDRANARVRLITGQQVIRDQYTTDLHKVRADLVTEESKQVAVAAHVGGFRHVATLFAVDVTTVLFWASIFYTAVFDPLAMILFNLYHTAVIADRERKRNAEELATQSFNAACNATTQDSFWVERK